MAPKVDPGIVSKHGKLRVLHKRPASKRSLEYQKVKYVRGNRDLPASGVRTDRVTWKRFQVVPQPLPSLWEGYFEEACPPEASKHQCSAKACRAYTVPHHLHAAFQVSSGAQRQPL